MKKILVTGGAGFIGSHLVERLVKDGYEVVVLDTELQGNKLPESVRSRITYYKEDVRDVAAVDKAVAGCDVIFHFAAVLGVDVVAQKPVETMEVEVVGTMNLAKAAIKHGVKRFLYASTSGVYGYTGDDQTHALESDPVAPTTSYAIAKRFNEVYLASLYQEQGLESVSLRFFNVYGPRQDERMVVPRFLDQAHKGHDITVFDEGTQTRDFTYIDDTIESCVQLMLKSGGAEIYNVANEAEINILELAHAIKEATDTSSNIILTPSPSDRVLYEVKRRFGSSEKLFECTGFRPGIGLKEGLGKIVVKQPV